MWVIFLNGWTQDAKNNLDKFIVTVASVVPNQNSFLCLGLLPHVSEVWFYVIPSLRCWNPVPVDQVANKSRQWIAPTCAKFYPRG